LGSKVDNKEINISFEPTPDYAGLAKAAAGGDLYAARADTVEELDKVLQEAVESVKNGTSAVIDAHIDGPEGKFTGDKEGVCRLK
jgi:thiamine pyrophosphate-dependent acetolactate synthase large subunit-like protein